MTQSQAERGGLESEAFPLYTQFPQLRSSLPRVPLFGEPTPVSPLARLGARVGQGSLWVKNDGLRGTLYGGNKTRKLEFILADALAKRAQTILTFGALGTNHGLATALYGRQHGLRTVLLLVYQPLDDKVRQSLYWLGEAGATLHYTISPWQTRLRLPFLFLRHVDWRRRRLPYFLMPGGSTPIGTVGYVNAAFELAQQVTQGELPEPQTIMVPLGSGGTAAGLLLGLRLSGLKSRLVTVCVSDTMLLTPQTVSRLANATADLLRRRGAGLPVPKIAPDEVTVLSDWLGEGYGYHTAKADEAQALLQETEDLALEPTYTAKTMAALLSLVERGHFGEGPVLYWHTYSALPAPFPPPKGDDYRRLPRAFHRFFTMEP
jgi:D-cysteine desulfhydrase